MAEGEWLAERIAGWLCSWAEYLGEVDDPEFSSRMVRAERTGRPLGDEGFVRQVGELLGRDLVPKKPGRKPKGR